MKTTDFIIKHKGVLRKMSTSSKHSIKQAMDEYTVEVLKYLITKHYVVSRGSGDSEVEARYLLSKYKEDALSGGIE